MNLDEISGPKKGWIFQINTSNGGVPKWGRPEAEITFTGLTGDRQRNTRHHGGPDRAICLFSLENILALQGEGHPVFPGAMGENLTLSGIEWRLVVPGVCIQLGQDALIEITKYTTPCSNLKPFFVDASIHRVLQSSYPDWSRVYARVIQPGTIKVGDRVEIYK